MIRYGEQDIMDAFPVKPNDAGNTVKPTFNLKSNVVITGGDGTKNNPFTVKLGQ